MFHRISREMDGDALASGTKVPSVVINKEGFFFFRPIAFAVICTLWYSPLPVPPLFHTFFFSNHSWFLTFIITCQQDLGILQLHPAKKQSHASRSVSRRGTHTWNEGSLWAENPLMLLGCFPRSSLAYFIWLLTAGL